MMNIIILWTQLYTYLYCLTLIMVIIIIYIEIYYCHGKIKIIA